MINYNIGSFTKKDYEAVAELALKYFNNTKDPSQIPSAELTYNLVTKTFPLSLSIIKNNEKPIGHTFILPCNNIYMKQFLKKEITEKELFFIIRDKVSQKTYTSLYLTSAQIHPTYQKKGIATKSLIKQITEYNEKYKKKFKLFYWPLSDEGKKLCQKVAKELNLPIFEVKNN